MKYKVHRFDLNMSKDKDKLEHYLNGFHGEVISLVPHVTYGFFFVPKVDFFLITEKIEN